MSKKIKIVQGFCQRDTKLLDNFVAITSKTILNLSIQLYYTHSKKEI